MKYKVGDKVRIKSLDWYNKNKDEYDYIDFGKHMFYPPMSKYCGEVFTIDYVYSDFYTMNNNDFEWTDGMIEGLVEEETLIERVDDNGLPFNEWLSHKGAFYIPDGYELKDENGNVINATKIVLEKKKKEYPKTYEECCVDLGLKVCPKVKVSIGDTPTYREHIVETFIELLACRDAYLKRYEIEMKLNSRWTPDYEDLNTTKFCITTSRDNVIKVESSVQNYVLAFPTEEMRDAFYKNFKSEIERCKELL